MIDLTPDVFPAVITPEAGVGFGAGGFIRGIYGDSDTHTVCDLEGASASVSGSLGPVSGSASWPISIPDGAVADFDDAIIEIGLAYPFIGGSFSLTGGYGF